MMEAVVGLELDATDLDVILEVRPDLRVQLEAATLAAQALLEACGVDLTRAYMCPARESPTSATCRRPDPWVVQAGPAGRALRGRAADVGAAHPADR